MPTAAVDGNVLRVVSRLEENATPISDTAYRKRLQEELTKVYPKSAEDCSAFTQALFELGALVCKPKNPDCSACPLSAFCGAYKRGTQSLYPVQPIKREKRREKVYVFLIETDEGFCIRRRERGVLRGMNELPSCVYESESAGQVLDEWGVDVISEVKRAPYKHVFTHIVWEITCVWVRAQSAPFDTYSLAEIKESVSLPTAFRQCLGLLGDRV
jgi:A/G-specific adenine glycosylase